MSKREAGSKGGRATVTKYGARYMAMIGRRGAATTWTRYYLAPIGQTQYALVERTTNRIKTIMEAR